jgi:hypothetical protein
MPAVVHNAGPETGIMKVSVYNGSTWITDKPQGIITHPDGSTGNIGPVNTDGFATEFDSYDQFNIAFSDATGLKFGTRGAMTDNKWVFADIEQGLAPKDIDMAMTINDMPYVAYSWMRQLYCATYNPQQNAWNSVMLAEIDDNIMSFSITADNAGGVGLAYVSYSNMSLNYLYNNGIDGWQASSPIAAAMTKSVSLAFDAQNNPVIAYTGQNGNLWLAYDPVVPEPLSICTMLLGSCVLLRSRRK